MPVRAERIGVVLFQLGGPDSLDAVEPFLRNLFSDPDIFDLPLARIARPIFARTIAKLRAQKIRQNYFEIGGKSANTPHARLAHWSKNFARALMPTFLSLCATGSRSARTPLKACAR